MTTVGARARRRYIGGKFCLSQNCLLWSAAPGLRQILITTCFPFSLRKGKYPGPHAAFVAHFRSQPHTVLVPPLRNRAIAQFLDKKTEAVDASLPPRPGWTSWAHAAGRRLQGNPGLCRRGSPESLQRWREIPAHWQVKKLAHLLVRNEGGTWGEEDPEGGDDSPAFNRFP